MSDALDKALDIVNDPSAYPDPIAAFDALADEALPEEKRAFILLGADLVRAMDEAVRWGGSLP
jgi:hypothetical protein